jgi:hypothetical protein
MVAERIRPGQICVQSAIENKPFVVSPCQDNQSVEVGTSWLSFGLSSGSAKQSSSLGGIPAAFSALGLVDPDSIRQTQIL